MKIRLQTVIQTEIDTDTGKSRILKQFTFPVGDKSAGKKKKRQLGTLTSQFTEELM